MPTLVSLRGAGGWPVEDLSVAAGVETRRGRTDSTWIEAGDGASPPTVLNGARSRSLVRREEPNGVSATLFECVDGSSSIVTFVSIFASFLGSVAGLMSAGAGPVAGGVAGGAAGVVARGSFCFDAAAIAGEATPIFSSRPASDPCTFL